MTNTRSLSVQKHRAKMAAEECARMEVTIGAGVISQARELARQRRRPLWEVVQDALEAYVATGQAAETDNAK